jgi:hypothetical protein
MQVTRYSDVLLFQEMLVTTDLDRLVQMFTAEHKFFEGRFDQTCYILYLQQNFYPLAVSYVYVAYYKDKGLCIRYGEHALKVENVSLQHKLLQLFDRFNYSFRDPIINYPTYETREYHEYCGYIVERYQPKTQRRTRTNRPEERNT